MSWKLLRAIIASGWSGLTYLLSGVPDDKGATFKHYWGLFSADMEPHWDRVEDPGDTFHDYKNITTEWCRAHAQPASKLLSALILIGWTGCFVSTLLALFFWLLLA